MLSHKQNIFSFQFEHISEQWRSGHFQWIHVCVAVHDVNINNAMHSGYAPTPYGFGWFVNDCEAKHVHNKEPPPVKQRKLLLKLTSFSLKKIHFCEYGND